jgi:hypothetical protein
LLEFQILEAEDLYIPIHRIRENAPQEEISRIVEESLSKYAFCTERRAGSILKAYPLANQKRGG